MVNAPTSAVEIAEAILSELDHFQKTFKANAASQFYFADLQLKEEPCVGYAVTKHSDGALGEIFVCRNSAPSNYVPSRSTIEYASYLAPLGKLIVRRPGEPYQFEVANRVGLIVGSHLSELKAKNEFRPSKAEDGLWEAIDNQISWVGGRIATRSLRRLLEGILEAETTRSIRYSVQLPDQAILDEAQDDIFRLPFSEHICISGAPGTGKTTVLLKRLSQKTKREFLTDAERKTAPDQIFKDGKNWILFTPSDLLKVYLKEAMAKELLPATDEHVKVYRTFRLEVLRDSSIIKVGQRGHFKPALPESPIMKRLSGAEQLSLNKTFGEYLASAYTKFFRHALQNFNNEIRAPLGELTDANQRVLVTALDIITKAGGDVLDLREAQQRAATYRKLNDDLTKIVQVIRAISAFLDNAQDVTPLTIYNQVSRWQASASALATAEIDKIDTAVFPTIPPLVSKLRKEVRDLNESLSLARLFSQIPRSFQEFRETPENQARFFAPEADKAIRDRQISESEQDVLLFQALEFTRQIRRELPNDLNGVPDDLRSMLARFRLLITVDEATDFSPLELACIERLTLPEGGVTISGDLMQRVTETGLREWSDTESVCRVYNRCELNTSYRQTERLFNIARDLYKHATTLEPKFKSAYPSRPEDPPALSHKSTKENPAPYWLVERICEIFALGNNHLPTTALLVPTQAEVEPLRTALYPLLHANGIELDATYGGQNLGDTARVRIFSVEHIKGLEFEAVFYVGLDRMAEIHKDLIDKYVYVGLSRARSFLGVTFERQFPTRLKCIESHFELGGCWDKVVTEETN